MTAQAESDLKPISHLDSKRVIAGKSSVPRSHIPSTKYSVCVEQPNNSVFLSFFFFCSTCDCFYLFCSQASVIHFSRFFSVAVSPALPNDSGVVSSPSAGFVHKLPPGRGDEKAEPQIIRAAVGSAALMMIPEKTEDGRNKRGIFPAPGKPERWCSTTEIRDQMC